MTSLTSCKYEHMNLYTIFIILNVCLTTITAFQLCPISAPTPTSTLITRTTTSASNLASSLNTHTSKKQSAISAFPNSDSNGNSNSNCNTRSGKNNQAKKKQNQKYASSSSSNNGDATMSRSISNQHEVNKNGNINDIQRKQSDHKKSLFQRKYKETSDEEDVPHLSSQSGENRNRNRKRPINGQQNGQPNGQQRRYVKNAKYFNSNTNARKRPQGASMTTTSSNGRTFRSSNNSNNNNNNNQNNAKRNYQQQRSKQRKSNNGNNNWAAQKKYYNKNQRNKRPARKVIELDLSKPTFTYHGTSPKLEQTPKQESESSTNESNNYTNNDNNDNNTPPAPTPKSNIITSPSVLKQNEQYCTPYICGTLPITYTNDPKTVERWLCDNIVKQPGHTFSFIGFDTESPPNVPWRTRTNSGSSSSIRYDRPATIQLSTPHSSLVIQMTPNYDHDRSNLLPIQGLLTDPSIIKAGAGIDDDMLELYRWDNSLHARSRFDIGGIGSPSAGSRVGLQRLVRAVVGVELVKSKRVTMSDWSQLPLSIKQLNYASRDAWAGAAVVETLELMYEDTMHVDLIGSMVLKSERDMVDIHIRAKERKDAKMKMKEIVHQMKNLSNYLKPEDNGADSRGGGGQSISSFMWSDVVREEKNRLQQIINDTAPDGLLFFPQESLGLDFSFEKKP